MSKLYLLLSYFFITPCIILLVLVILLFDRNQYKNPHQAATFSMAPSTVYAALPDDSISTLMETTVTTSDARVPLIQQFLTTNHSPLAQYADLIVNTADQFGIDYRLVTAIAGQESNWCRVIPPGSYNCWGFGIYTGHLTKFTSYQEGIETVTQTLATKYKDQGLITPQQIMTKYTPSSPHGNWATGVTNIMTELE